jgi:hypothetical protein
VTSKLQKSREPQSDVKPAIFTVKLVLNGRITIPENLRAIWNLTEGDMVEIQILRVLKQREAQR